MSLYQPHEPNSYSSDNTPWDQGYPSHRPPPPYDAGSPISDDGWAEDPEYNTPDSEKPGWSMTARHINYGSLAPMRHGRAAQYPGGDNGWQQTPGGPGLATGFDWVSPCPECGKTNQMADEWGCDGRDEPSNHYYANLTGYPYGGTPTQTQQQSRHSPCSFCGQTRSTTAYPQQPAGTGRALALAPARAEDTFYETGTYYGPSFPGHYSREAWHTGSPGAPHVQFNDANRAYQAPYSSMGTGPYGHYWQQRHQGSYSPSPSVPPYDMQPSYYSTMDAYGRANQGISVGGYPYRVSGMGMSGAAIRRMHASCRYSSLHYTSTGGMGMGSSPYGGGYGESDEW